MLNFWAQHELAVAIDAFSEPSRDITDRQKQIKPGILPAMNITLMGQVHATMQELLTLRLKHVFSAAYPAPTDISPEQRCGTETKLNGYTEWVGDTELPISIGWDWHINLNPTVQWQRGDLPHTNIQLLDEFGQPLAWTDNLRMLSTWIDTQAWIAQVARAVSDTQCPCVSF